MHSWAVQNVCCCSVTMNVSGQINRLRYLWPESAVQVSSVNTFAGSCCTRKTIWYPITTRSLAPAPRLSICAVPPLVLALLSVLQLVQPAMATVQLLWQPSLAQRLLLAGALSELQEAAWCQTTRAH